MELQPFPCARCLPPDAIGVGHPGVTATAGLYNGLQQAVNSTNLNYF